MKGVAAIVGCLFEGGLSVGAFDGVDQEQQAILNIGRVADISQREARALGRSGVGFMVPSVHHPALAVDQAVLARVAGAGDALRIPIVDIIVAGIPSKTLGAQAAQACVGGAGQAASAIAIEVLGDIIKTALGAERFGFEPVEQDRKSVV